MKRSFPSNRSGKWCNVICLQLFPWKCGFLQEALAEKSLLQVGLDSKFELECMNKVREDERIILWHSENGSVITGSPVVTTIHIFACNYASS